MMHGKDVKKKWKWQTPDHAGTRPLVKSGEDIRHSMLDFAAVLTGKAPQKTGSIEEIAKVKGLPMVYRDENGNIFDEHGARVESKRGLVFIPLPK